MGVYSLTGQSLGQAYGVNGSSLPGIYTKKGTYISLDNSPPPTPIAVDYNNYTFNSLFTLRGGNFDGHDIYDNVMVQFEANNKVWFIDMATGKTIVGSWPISSGHGDVVSFTKEKYDVDDKFPMIFITPDTSTPHVYLSRIIGEKENTVVKDFVFPIERTGYYAAHAYDEDNKIMYLIGYLNDNYSSDENGNKTVVSCWNMADITDNGDNTFTPAFISSYERDFIYVMQDIKFHDGYIWIASGYWDSNYSRVYAMRPGDGVIDYTIILPDTEEIEGISWVYDSTDNMYHMIVVQQGHVTPYSLKAYRVDFTSAELPDGYQRLKCIVGNNTASNFNTGVSGNNNNLRIECCFARDRHTNYSPFWGNYVGETTNAFRLIERTDTTNFLANANTQANQTRNVPMGSSWLNRKVYSVVERSKAVFWFEDGNPVVNSAAKSDGTANNTTIDIGNGKVANGSTGSTRTKWYYVRIWDSDTMIRNYIPCKRTSDNKLGFYDTVNDTFNPSTGAADFLSDT